MQDYIKMATQMDEEKNFLSHRHTNFQVKKHHLQPQARMQPPLHMQQRNTQKRKDQLTKQ